MVIAERGRFNQNDRLCNQPSNTQRMVIWLSLPGEKIQPYVCGARPHLAGSGTPADSPEPRRAWETKHSWQWFANAVFSLIANTRNALGTGFELPRWMNTHPFVC